MAKGLGAVYVAVKADLKPLEKGFDAAKKRALTFGKTVERGFTKIKSSVLSLKGAIIGFAAAFGAVQMGKSFIEAASTAENFRVRLNATLGSVQEGSRMFKEMADFAGRVPFEYEEIMKSATALSGVVRGGVDEVNKLMPVIADLAAVSGLSVEEATGQIIRMYSAGAGAADLFRERGILAMMGFEAGVSYSAEETMKKVFASWNSADSKFKGVTDDLAKTWGGLTSMMSDKWFDFRRRVSESGPFQALKQGLKSFIDYLNTNQGKMDLAGWANMTARAILGSFQIILSGVSKVLWVFEKIRDTYKTIIGISLKAQISRAETELNIANAKLNAMQPKKKLFSSDWQGTVYSKEEQRSALEEVQRWQQKVADLQLDLANVGQSLVDENSIDAARKKLLELDSALEKMKTNAGSFGPASEIGGDGLKSIGDDVKNAKTDVESLGDVFKDDLQGSVEGWGSSFSSTLTDMVFGAKTSFQEIAASFAKMITNMIIQFVTLQAIKVALAPFTGGASLLVLAAAGGVFGGSGISSMSNRIIDKPTIIPMATGGVLTGEAGTEAVMPLTRMPSGNLGVESTGKQAKGETTVYIDMRNAKFEDKQERQKEYERVASVVAAKIAPNAIVRDYYNDGPVRRLFGK